MYKLLSLLTWQPIGMCCTHTWFYLLCAFQFVATTSDLQNISWNMLKSITYSEPIFELFCGFIENIVAAHFAQEKPVIFFYYYYYFLKF